MLYYSGLSRTLRSCAGCFTRAAALFVTGCWGTSLPARTAPMAGRAAPCTLHAAARLRALPGTAGWGSRTLPIHRPCPPRGAAGEISGAPWAAVELGVEMARLLFGSEIRMRGSEPLPEPVPGLDRGYDCILPVPASSKKRGYNVPERMAQPLARAVGVPVVTDVLTRARSTRRQEGLSLDERLANVAGAFRVARPEAVEGKRILLVDDVLTTGATASACAQALLDAGAQSVFAVALATVEFPQPVDRTAAIAENEEEI